MIKIYENKIKNAETKEEIKEIVRKLFKDVEKIDDITFNEFIYQDIIPKLEELGVVFDRENYIDYEIVMKEEY